jgi:hypothetical protein
MQPNNQNTCREKKILILVTLLPFSKITLESLQNHAYILSCMFATFLHTKCTQCIPLQFGFCFTCVKKKKESPPGAWSVNMYLLLKKLASSRNWYYMCLKEYKIIWTEMFVPAVYFLVYRKSKIGYKRHWRINWRRARTKMITKIVKGIETGRWSAYL